MADRSSGMRAAQPMPVPSSVAALIPLLKTDPSSQTAIQASQEASLLEDVAVQYSTTYDFVSSNSPSSRAFGELFDVLVKHRLVAASWRGALRPDHLLRLLQCCRLLSRDGVLRQRLVESGGVKGPRRVAGGAQGAAAVGRPAASRWWLSRSCRCRTARGESLVALKELPLSDVGLFGATESEVSAGVGRMGKEVEILSSLSHPNIVQAPDLLALLARRESVVSELLALSGLGRLVGQLAPGGDGQLAQSLLRVLCYVAADAGAVAELYHVGSIPVLISLVGSIPVLISLVGSSVRELAASPSHNCLPPGRCTELQLAATALTRLAEHDECSAQIRACNGVTLLGKLLLVAPAKGEGALFEERSA
ncbi:Serine/threonine-protein kinase Nek10 [Tetrabaena socialis]|uniref:Serine/threonine-protein kinase Nek10 n=1 Tax=Tetrabaena socialis TaxID=47790 RepID=A0A2J7ZVR4_9CHLO|nr:Serine/threonine-protein kinase Nek10 [Tetrabaena socialis]|eukprot:PNH04362.1 Serine/threonine-protein kinase Nek10 [Tetrabaena socialis]